jgi:sugar lactone lactonase YvrE
VWRFNRWGLPTHYVRVPRDSFFTNVVFGPGKDGTHLYMTDALRGEIWRARMPAAQ